MREIIFLNESKNRSVVDGGGKGNTGQGGANTIYYVDPKAAAAVDPTIYRGDYTPLQKAIYEEYEKYVAECKKKGEKPLPFAKWSNTDDPPKKPDPEAAIKLYSEYKKAQREGFKGTYDDWLRERAQTKYGNQN